MSELFACLLIFHIAVPLIVFELPLIKRKFEFNRFALIIGSLFPDIVDKSLLLMNLGFGRGFSHTILFALVSVVIIHLILKGKFSISITFLAGLIFHLILDLPEVPLFYPFIAYDFYVIEEPIGLWLYKLFNDPGVYLTEIAGFLILVYISTKNRLFNRKTLVKFLKQNNDNVTRQNTMELYRV